MNARRHQFGRGVVIAIALAVTIVWLVRVDGPAHEDDFEIAFEITRTAALCLAGYLLLLTCVGATARAFGMSRTTRIVDRVTVPVLRGLLSGTASLTLLAAPSSIAASTGPARMSVDEATPPPDDTTATLHLLTNASEPEPEPVAASTAPVDHDVWIVEPGDSFWTIARSAVTERADGDVDDRSIQEYWTKLIEANRDRLVDPTDADLLFTDQELVLPAVDG